MNRLLIDVSTDMMYIGLAKDDKLIDFCIRLAKQDHARYLVDRISFLLNANNLDLDQVNEIIVGIGPGSYTGLRIALMVAKMLSYTKEIPLSTISSLFLLTSGYNRKVVAMMDARRGNVFSAIYHKGKTVLKDELRNKNELLKLEEAKRATKLLIDNRNFKIDIKRVLENRNMVLDVHKVVPNYLRKTEAEINYAKSNDC